MNRFAIVLFVVAVLLVFQDAALAAGSNMPWEGPAEQILKSISGPIAKVIGAIAIIGLGIGMAFSEGGTMMRKALAVGLGLSIAFTATSFGIGFFGFSGGAGF